MFRLKMAASLSALLILVLILAAALFWGSNEAEEHFHRSDVIYDVLDTHLVLDESVDRYFQEHMSTIMLNSSTDAPIQAIDGHGIEPALADARRAIRLESAELGEQGASYLAEGLQHLDQLEQHLDLTVERFRLAAELKRQGDHLGASAIVSETYSEIFEREIWPIIHSVMREKSQEVSSASKEELNVVAQLSLLSVLIPGGSIVVTLLVGLHLYRSLTFPLQKLLEGAKHIGDGDLQYQIPDLGNNEFGRLGNQFNSMSSLVWCQQQELMNSNALLESQVAERTRELTQANDKLKRVAILRSRFFADISHELRTPLTIIRGEAEVSLRAKNQSVEDYRESMQHIVDLNKHLCRMVDDLFYLSRSGSGGLRYEPEPLEFNNLLKDCLQECEVLIDKSGLTLEVVYPETESQMMADRDRLRQTLLIVIENACRYSPKGGQLSFRLFHSEGRACLEVTDQGVGIKEAELSEVFERHYRSAQGRALVSNGAGLGLPLAKAIVDNHKGSIDIKSKPGVGTTVKICLPLMQT